MVLKQVTVSDVAGHIIQLFRLRFEIGGSLYSAHDGKIFVGPIVSTPFYRALDGIIRFHEPVDDGLALYRGPFNSASAYLRSSIDAELYLVDAHRQHILKWRREPS